MGKPKIWPCCHFPSDGYHPYRLVTLSPEERRQFAEDMIILHSAAVLAFSIMDLIKEGSYANPSNGKSQVFYRKLVGKMLAMVGFPYFAKVLGRTSDVIFTFRSKVFGTYRLGLTAILAFLLAKTSAQGAATAGLLAVKEAVTTIRPWFDFLETMRAFHTLMILVWTILGGILG